MLQGALIAESLRAGTELDGCLVRVTRITRVTAAGSPVGRPRHWTLLDFTARESNREDLARTLAAALAPVGGWHVSFTTTLESFVVFPGKVFRYPRGQAEGRRQAQDYARSVGVPDLRYDVAD